ncbi:phage tail protein [Candidatus Schmidhempelia bombi]|uniref:Tail fiber protein n=1 Tax=Candidatus Schmidhempelia bombi str. Bimp TaxID=1387197 RepID=A0AB94IC14_9GAMM|nr:phage tail protein [Candidatus Schmidhempelia bombi]TEA26950.1 hypothetical protein O970_06185 [Candidatus Schmidhempelia bombi str. Bimp]
MHRIDTPTAQKDKFGEGKNGFTKGNPQTGTPATQLDYLYCDAIQEEIANAIESAGIKLNKSKHNQLASAIKELITKGKVTLSSATNSTSETEAATPKAIKAAYDLANEKLSLTGGKLTGDLIIEKMNASIQLSTSGTNYVLSTSENGDTCSFYFPDAEDNYTHRLIYTKENKTFNYKHCDVRIDDSVVITAENINNYVQPLGYNQKWYDVTKSRQANIIYTNTTGRAIFVSIVKDGVETNTGYFYVDDILVGINTRTTPSMQVTAIVPAGSSYYYTSKAIESWAELR